MEEGRLRDRIDAGEKGCWRGEMEEKRNVGH